VPCAPCPKIGELADLGAGGLIRADHGCQDHPDRQADVPLGRHAVSIETPPQGSDFIVTEHPIALLLFAAAAL
jgi:hypothetical protein